MIKTLDVKKMAKLCVAYEVIASELDLDIDNVIESFEFVGYDSTLSQELILFYHYKYSLSTDAHREKNTLTSD